MKQNPEIKEDKIARLNTRLKQITAGVLVAAALVEMVSVAFIKKDGRQ